MLILATPPFCTLLSRFGALLSVWLYSYNYNQAMDAAVVHGEPVALLNAVLVQAVDRSPKVASEGMLCVDKCLARLETGGLLASESMEELDFKAVVLALVGGSRSKAQPAREAASRAAERRV